jgi:uncharacterized protein YkwD
MELRTPGRRAFTVLLVLVGACLWGQVAAQERAPRRDDPKKDKDAEVTPSPEEQAIIDLTNKEREAAGLKPLKFNPKLTKAARAHSANMARQDQLAHELDGKSVADRARAAGYAFASVGENVARGYRSPEELMAAWMESKPHRENILRAKFTEIGVGRARSERGEYFHTQVFGTPRGK